MDVSCFAHSVFRGSEVFLSKYIQVLGVSPLVIKTEVRHKLHWRYICMRFY